jgi:hypothetical protein
VLLLFSVFCVAFLLVLFGFVLNNKLNVACVSDLSILDCFFGFLYRLFDIQLGAHGKRLVETSSGMLICNRLENQMN